MAKVKFTKRTYKEHNWVKREDGSVDTFALSYGFCNGPACKRCGFSFCEHCNPDGWKSKCVVTHYRCPNCNYDLGCTLDKFCRICGEHLDWKGVV